MNITHLNLDGVIGEISESNPP